MATKELTPQEEANQKLADLQYQQQLGDTKKVKANLNEDHEINEYDQDYVHVLIETKSFNASRNDMDVNQVVKKFHPNVFDKLKDNLGGTSQTVIHDPKENARIARLKYQKAAKESELQEKAQAEQERIAKEQSEAATKAQAEIDAQQKKIDDASKEETKKANK
jgi:uncharacterized protein with von Willebrand factor type A (vWA) domain